MQTIRPRPECNRLDRGWLAVGASLAGLALVAPAWGADLAGQITATTGAVAGPDGQGALGDGEHVKVGEDGACAMLVDSDAVVELCGQTSLALQKNENTGTRIVALDRGAVRVVVEPRRAGERVEIHTPAAIATLLGTIVHVSVDPVTGATTIASAESRVSIRSRDPKVKGTTVISALEEVTVNPGERPPERPHKVDRQRIDELGGCLVDFHSAALGTDASEHRRQVSERLAATDAAGSTKEGSLTGGPATKRPGPNPPPPGSPIGGSDACVVTDCGGDPLLSEPSRPPQQGGSFGYPGL